MRIVQLITQTRGGPVDHALVTAVELARLGHESHVVAPPGGHLDVLEGHGVRTEVAEMTTRTDRAGARAVVAAVTSVRPDVVHLQDRRAGLVGRALPSLRQVPSVYTLHGVPDELAALVPGNLPIAPAGLRHKIDYLLVERLLATSRRSSVVVPCEALAAYARDRVRLPADRVHVVHNGVGQDWTSPTAEAAQSPAAGRLRVTWLGVMAPVKRVPDLVRAAARVDGIELQLVGDGPERARIEAVVAETGSSDRVDLAGFQTDPAPFVRGADVFVLPSAAEACPMALLQAMASGVPVVATRVGGIPEIVRDGVDGILVDPGSVDQLAAALARLVGDPGLRQRLAAAGRQRVADRFDVDRSVRALLDVYEEVAA
ncbi:glycosyltransferase family 4 protein [Nocardioides stalactiti]|uniref:glycosyltransferase family 4 protein n=1 Tax=Nocardioides stalactiti TaxID=2755356 RepID=UPI0015FFE955|nr:glycosyltransferase family 4 protein [Nocardioides stalactiti]